MVPAIPEFMYLYWYFSELFLQQYKCINSAFFGFNVGVFVFVMFISSPQMQQGQLDGDRCFLAFPTTPTRWTWSASRAMTTRCFMGSSQWFIQSLISKTWKKLDGEIQNVWSLSYTYVVNKKLFLEYSEQSIIEAWKLSRTWNTTLKENLWPMWIQCPLFSPAQSSCRVTTFFSRVLLQ